MLDPAKITALNEAIAKCVNEDIGRLHALRKEIRPLRENTQAIRPRRTTSMSLVGTDGGNSQLQFDPLLVQLIRVVDSSDNEHCLEVISPSTPIEELDRMQFGADGRPATALGELMACLGASSIGDLSSMLRPKRAGRARSAQWIEKYREIVEWATLFKLLDKDYGTDTIIVFDGLLRSLAFSRDILVKLLDAMEERIQTAKQRHNSSIYIVGLAKKSKVLDRYRLAMALEDVLRTDYPSYVEVPKSIEELAYDNPRYADLDAVRRASGSAANWFAAGKMFLVKFGASKHDPIWPVDIFGPQADMHDEIFGGLVHDAKHGFPVPHYPMCLQRAHEKASLSGFDLELVHDRIRKCMREHLGPDAEKFEQHMLQDINPASGRYE